MVEQGTVTVPLMELTPLNVPLLLTVIVVLVELVMVMPLPTCQATLLPAGKLVTEYVTLLTQTSLGPLMAKLGLKIGIWASGPLSLHSPTDRTLITPPLPLTPSGVIVVLLLPKI